MAGESEIAATVDRVIDALTPLGFEPVVADSSGNEPCASLDLGDGRWLDITAKVSEP
jgi:hypothetical protein